MKKNYGTAILAGGAGSRMGHTNKAKLLYGGYTFIGNLIDQLRQTGMTVYVSVAHYDISTPGDVLIVPDDVWDERGHFTGPMGGIYSCLKKAEQDGLAGLFFCPCDAPMFSRTIIEKLSELVGDDCDAVIIRTPDGKLQTTFGYYSITSLPVLQEDLARGHYKLVKSLERIRTKVIESSECGLPDHLFMNINTSDDYHRLQEQEHHRKEKKQVVFAVGGKKNSGKTTLITRLIKQFNRDGLKTAVIKHDGHDFECDIPGKDTYQFAQAGAYGTAIFSAYRMFVQRIESGTHESEMISYFPDADIVILEGFNDSCYPKLEVIRREISSDLRTSPEGRFLIVSDMNPQDISGWCGEPVLRYEQLDEIKECIFEWANSNSPLQHRAIG